MNKYEALGRYTETTERIEKAKLQCNIVEKNMRNALSQLSHSTYREFDKQSNAQALRELTVLLPQLEQTYQEIAELVEMQNQYAELCDKPQINIL